MNMMGQVEVPAIVPNKLTEAKFPLTFFQRFQTMILNLGFYTLTYYMIYPKLVILAF